MRAKDIAKDIGLTRSIINSYLYSKKSGALGKTVYQDSNYGWHLKTVAAHYVQSPSTPSRQASSSTAKVGSSSQRLQQPSLDRYISVQISLREAFKGVHKAISNDNRTVEVNIPARTRPGTQRIRGKGELDALTNRRGNLYYWVNLLADEPMTLSGDDVIYRVSIDSALAVNGGQITVPTLESNVKVKIPAGVKSGSKLGIKQQGWLTSSGSRGYQYILLEVRESPTIVAASPEPTEFYSPEVVRAVFRNDDYAMLRDDEQGKLAEMLEKAELAQRQQKQSLTRAQKPQPLTVLTAGWFWFAVAFGGIVTYGGLQLASQLSPLPSVPVEKQAP